MKTNVAQIVLVRDINLGTYLGNPNNSNPDNLIAFNDKLYFTAHDGVNGNELWVSDGTTEGTELVKDIFGGRNGYGTPSGSFAYGMTIFNDKLYFNANDGVHGTELWVSDGTTEGTQLLLDINPGTQPASSLGYDDRETYYNSSFAYDFTELNDKLYFTANDGVHGSELWVSDGTTEGTQLLLDIYPGNDTGYNGNAYPNSSFPSNLTELNDKLYFSANDGVHGSELWISDGTTEGTQLLLDIHPGNYNGYYNAYPNSSSPSNLTVLNDKLYFNADDGVHGSELWVSDGTTEGTQLLLDINPGYYNSFAYSSFPSKLTVLNDKLYFNANDGVHGTELWVSDGTTEGTQLLLDINRDSTYGPSLAVYIPSRYPSNFTEFNEKLYFTNSSGLDINSNQLWVSDGTTEGTQLIIDIDPGDQNNYYGLFSNPVISNLTEFNDKLYFTATDENHGNELWVSDGTTEGTQLFADLNPGIDSSSPSNLVVIGDELFFSADNGINGRELFKLTFDESTIITGTDLADNLSGTKGADRIEGLKGNDILSGHNGNDTLLGGAGFDLVTGGMGNDLFVLKNGNGSDMITDFQIGSDQLGLTDGLTFNDLTFSGNNINSGDELLAVLIDIDTSDLTEADFTEI